jgi:zinc protease
VLTNPIFPQKDLDRLKQNTIAAIQQEKVQPISMALRVLPLLLYGQGHAYAMPLTGTGTEETVKAMTREHLQRFHSTWVKPNNTTMIVVGDVTMAALRPKLEQAFASWKSGDVPRKEIAEVPPRQGPEVFLLDRPGAEQTVILSAQLAPPKSLRARHGIPDLQRRVRWGIRSRVNLNLREDKHWSWVRARMRSMRADSGCGSCMPRSRPTRPKSPFRRSSKSFEM